MTEQKIYKQVEFPNGDSGVVLVQGQAKDFIPTKIIVEEVENDPTI